MTNRRHAMIALVAALLSPATAAQAQWYSSASAPPPLYPYAVQVAPNTYVIHRPNERQSEMRRARPHRQAAATPVATRRHSKADPVLIEELRKRPRVERPAVHSTTQVVQEKPIVHETTRYVDDPPRVVERRRYADGRPLRLNEKRSRAVAGGAHVISRQGADNRALSGNGDNRVISADAEITILGPDRMNIRLFRKGDRAKAAALPNED